LGLPAGVLVGTAVGVAAGQFALGFPSLPSFPGGNSLLLIMVGLFVGSRITRTSLSYGARSLLPASLLAAILLFVGVLSALFVSRTVGVDLRTALFAAAPGGITEMSTVGASLGADGAVVASIHLVRILLTILAVAGISRLLKDGQPLDSGRAPEAAGAARDAAGRTRTFVPGLAGGVLGGLVGLASPVPAGALVGALCGSATVALWRDLSIPLPGLRVAVQALGGAAIGLRVGEDFLSGLVDWAAAGAIIIGVQMCLWPLVYLMLSKLFDYEAPTALLASAPGGMSEIVSSAPDARADPTVVAFGHLVRLTAVIVVIPYIFLVLL
jgi:membrane AbrB-like protein